MRRLVMSVAAVLSVGACAAEPEGPPPPPPPRTSADLVRALMSDAEAGGQRQAEQPGPVLADCDVDAPTARAAAVWTLPEDRRVTHAIEAHPRPADLVAMLREKAFCLSDGQRAFPGPVIGGQGEDAQHTWCVDLKPRWHCGAVLAQGDLLVAVAAIAEVRRTAETTVFAVVVPAMAGVERVGVRTTTAPPPPTTTTTTTTAPRRSNADLIAAALTPEELAGEGDVRLIDALQRPYLELCTDAKPLNKSLMMWELPGGRSLIHVVESYEDAAEQFSWLISRRECFTGRGVPALAGPELLDLDVDQRMSLCFDRDGTRSCTAVVTKGDLMMAVTVEADTVNDANAIVERIMPKAVAALDRA